MGNFKKLGIVQSVAKIVDVCTGVKKGEKVLIVTDTAFDQSIVEVYAMISLDRGAEVNIISMEPVSRPGEAPPEVVYQACLSADVIFELTSQWIASSKARIDSCAKGARFMSQPQMSYAMLRKNGPLTADFVAIDPIARKVMDKFTHAKKCRVVTKAGTDLVASLEGRNGRCLTGVGIAKGAYQGPPDIEAGVGPVEESVNGVIIADGIIEFLGGGIEHPFRIDVKNGKIVNIQKEGKGKAYAQAFQNLLDSCKDPKIYQIAEIALGLNPYSTMCDDAIESESSLGSAHFGVGDNIGYGGINKAPGHFDVVVQDATLYLDEELIIKDGQMLAVKIPK